ncbi:hypothetical protein Dimus_022911 [Dionaea muscipula]
MSSGARGVEVEFGECRCPMVALFETVGVTEGSVELDEGDPLSIDSTCSVWASSGWCSPRRRLEGYVAEGEVARAAIVAGCGGALPGQRGLLGTRWCRGGGKGHDLMGSCSRGFHRISLPVAELDGEAEGGKEEGVKLAALPLESFEQYQTIFQGNANANGGLRKRATDELRSEDEERSQQKESSISSPTIFDCRSEEQKESLISSPTSSSFPFPENMGYAIPQYAWDLYSNVFAGKQRQVVPGSLTEILSVAFLFTSEQEYDLHLCHYLFDKQILVSVVFFDSHLAFIYDIGAVKDRLSSNQDGEVMETEGFKHLQVSCPSLLSELLEMVASVDENTGMLLSRRSSSSVFGIDLAVDGAPIPAGSADSNGGRRVRRRF